MPTIFKVAFALGALYLAVMVALFFAQRMFIFPAPTSPIPPPPGFEQVLLRTDPGRDLTAAYRPARAGRDTIVFFHGNADNWAGGSQATQLLAEAGYGVLLPEYRGYSGNPGKPDETGLYEDGRAALNWLSQQRVTAKQTVLIGNSLGSGVAVQLASESPAAALVLISGYSSMVDVVGEKVSWMPTSILVRDKFDNRAKLPDVQMPVLIVHGMQDGVIPVVHAQRLENAHPAAELLLFADAGHELAYRPEASEAVREWLGTLPQNLPAATR